MVDARSLALAVPVEYRYSSGGRTAREPSYAKTYSVVEAIYGSPSPLTPLRRAPPTRILTRPDCEAGREVLRPSDDHVSQARARGGPRGTRAVRGRSGSGPRHGGWPSANPRLLSTTRRTADSCSRARQCRGRSPCTGSRHLGVRQQRAECREPRPRCTQGRRARRPQVAPPGRARPPRDTNVGALANELVSSNHDQTVRDAVAKTADALQ
jgi:hypothetical protein